ncbi:hypothetical protein D9M71_621460 [compost metagenome]
MPAIGDFGSFLAAGLTTSFAPSTSTTSAWPNSELMSSISNTWSYGTSASASSTFMCPGMRPATGWIAYFTVTPRWVSFSVSSLSACCARATARP